MNTGIILFCALSGAVIFDRIYASLGLWTICFVFHFFSLFSVYCNIINCRELSATSEPRQPQTHHETNGMEDAKNCTNRKENLKRNRHLKTDINSPLYTRDQFMLTVSFMCNIHLMCHQKGFWFTAVDRCYSEEGVPYKNSSEMSF